MIGRAIATAIALVSLAACATYAGGARSLDPQRLTTEPGWIVAGTTPELHQQGEHDCGATALAMVAGRWRVPLSLDRAFEVVVAMHPAMDEFVTLDPALGARTRSWANLDAEWRPVGRPALVVLGPTAPDPLAAHTPRVARAVSFDLQ